MPRPDRSRAALLSTTGDLLRRQGYASTGLAQIVTESGTSAGSLYHHFPGGKEALAVAAIDAAGGWVAAQLGRLLEAEPDVPSAVCRWLDVIGAILAADPLDGCPVAPVAVESLAASPRLRAAAAHAFQAWQARLAAALAEAGWPAASAESEATALVALVEGALLLARTSGSTAPLDAARQAARRLLTTPR